MSQHNNSGAEGAAANEPKDAPQREKAPPPIKQKAPSESSSIYSSKHSSKKDEKQPSVKDQSAQAASSKASSKAASSKPTGSSRSITSSQALGKLKQLEDLLLEERHARENAENLLIALQQERLAREDSAKKSERAQTQLLDVMSALRSVVDAPTDRMRLRKLQTLLHNAPPDTLQAATPPNTPPSERGNKKPRSRPASEASSTASSVKRKDTAAKREDVSFLDSLGQYERDREKEKLKVKRAARAQAAATAIELRPS